MHTGRWRSSEHVSGSAGRPGSWGRWAGDAGPACDCHEPLPSLPDVAIDPYQRKEPASALTSRDVARAAGVSQSTVSYVMSGKRPISEATRRRVQEAIDRLTYQPNASARALAGRRTQVVGLMAPFGEGADAHELLPFIEYVTARARLARHDVLLVTSAEGPAGLLRLAGQGLCDGIVVLDVAARDERVPVAARLSVPVVLIGVPADPMGLDCVDVDYRSAGRLAVEELAAAGHGQVIILGHPASVLDRDLHFVTLFEAGAAEAAARHGVTLEIVSPVEYGRAGAERAASEVSRRRRDGSRLGVVLCKPRGAQFLLDALSASGLVPGADISVLGLCSDNAAQEMSLPLSNISVETKGVCDTATDILLRSVDAGRRELPGRLHLIPPRLVARRTVLA